MTPLHAWALWGTAAGLALPILIHFLTKPRGVRLALPPFRFIRECGQRSIRRAWLRNLLVLLTRALGLACLGLAFARLAHWAPAPDARTPQQDRAKVVVLDCSLSMLAARDGTPLFDRARAAVLDLLQSSGTRQADLILAATRARAVFGKLSPNLQALLGEAAQARALPQELNATAALTAAAASLKGVDLSAPGAAEIVVVTDLQRSNWSRARFEALPKDVPLRIISVRGKANPGNVALQKLELTGVAEAGASLLAVGDVVNYGPEPVQARLELSFDGRTWSQERELAASAVERVGFEIRDLSPGWRRGQLRVTVSNPAQDALPDDNLFPLCIRARPARRVALLTQESAAELGGPAFFLEHGLAAQPSGTVQVERYDPSRLEGEIERALWESDLLAVVHPGLLSDAQARALGRLLSAGKPILYVTQFPEDADNLRSLQAQLGAALRLAEDFTAYQGGDGAGALERLLGRQGRGEEGGRFLVELNQERRPFKLFGESIVRFTAGLKLTGGLATRPVSGALLEKGSVLARYSDKSVALLLTQVAAGRLAILNMAVGGQEVHLAASPIFVPVLQELALELLGAGADGSVPQALCGQPFQLAVPRWIWDEKAGERAVEGAGEVAARPGSGESKQAGAEGWELEREPPAVPGELRQQDFRFETDAAGLTFHWPAAGQPGTYFLKRAGKALAGFTVVPPVKQEGDLAGIDEVLLKQRLAADRSLTLADERESAQPEERVKESFAGFLVAALACLALELAILKCFRS